MQPLSDPEIQQSELFTLGRTMQRVLYNNYGVDEQIFDNQDRIQESLNTLESVNGGELREIVKVLREILVNRQYQDYQAVVNNL